MVPSAKRQTLKVYFALRHGHSLRHLKESTNHVNFAGPFFVSNRFATLGMELIGESAHLIASLCIAILQEVHLRIKVLHCIIKIKTWLMTKRS